MADIRSFRNYIEELSGNNFLRKKVKTLERKNKKLGAALSDLLDEVKYIKKNMAKPIPKPKGRKPRPMIRIIEDEMAKRSNKTMKVTEIVKILKRKHLKTKAQSLYSSVSASLANSDKFEKAGPGQFKLVSGKKTGRKTAKKASAKKARKK
jgi:hypothetical protein